jgi:CelD/BcsL family acetyltransferase involved in cellulose biosynthesis
LSEHCWESYFGSLGSSHRYNLRRRLRNITQEFDVQLEEIQTEEKRKEGLQLVVDLHHKRWDERGGSMALHTPALLAFHDEITHFAASNGWLRIYVLRLNDKPVASIYGFRYNDTFYFYQSGFDPEYATHSVGLIILGLTIKKAVEEGMKEYNLLQGQEAYKYLWAQDERELFHMELYPPRARGTLYREAMELRRNIKQLIWQYFPSWA